MNIIRHTGHDIFNSGKKFWQLSQKSFQEHQDWEYADDIPENTQNYKKNVMNFICGIQGGK